MASITIDAEVDVNVRDIVQSASIYERTELLKELLSRMDESYVLSIMRKQGYSLAGDDFGSVPSKEYSESVSRLSKAYMSISTEDQNTIMAIAAKY